MLACSYQNAGLRVFDVRDPYHPKEIAYWKPPAVRTAVQPGSGAWAPGVDRTVDKIAGYVSFRKVPSGHNKAQENGNEDAGAGLELQLWTVSDGNGLQVLRFTDNFKALHKDLLEEAGEYSEEASPVNQATLNSPKLMQKSMRENGSETGSQ
jgi:hypothetical protein